MKHKDFEVYLNGQYKGHIIGASNREEAIRQVYDHFKDKAVIYALILHEVGMCICGG